MFAAPTKKKSPPASKPAPQTRSVDPAANETLQPIFFQLATQPVAAVASGQTSLSANGASHPRGTTSSSRFSLIVEDGSALGPGQIYRSEFVESMSAAIERVADEELRPAGQTARNCPYLNHWLQFYRDRPVAHIERVIQHYARPERADLEGLQEAVLRRVRTAVQAWIRSGGREIQAPEGVNWLGNDDGVARESTTALNPAVVRSQLGNGQPLAGSVRWQMESGFGQSFSDVRIHTDDAAARLTRSFSARAFTIGNDIAFSGTQYQPGTLYGDAILAHELAHVIQQNGSAHFATSSGGHASRTRELEREADGAATQVVRSIWSPTQTEVISPKPTPASVGLRLQRCSDDSIPLPTPAPPEPTPEEQMTSAMHQAVQDHIITPADWQLLHERAQTLHLDEYTIDEIARREAGGGLASQAALQVAVVVARNGPAFDSVRSTYRGDVAPGADDLTPALLPVLLRAALADSMLDFNELDAMRRIALRGRLPDYGDLRAALLAANVAPATVDGIVRVFDIGSNAWKSLASETVSLPLRLSAATEGAPLTATGDLRVLLIRALTGDGSWSRLEFPIIRSLLQPLGRQAATQLLVSAGIPNAPADQLAQQFTASDAAYARRTPEDIRFRRDGRNFVPVTPLFPEVPQNSLDVSATLGFSGDLQQIGDFRFDSGMTTPAARQIVVIQGRQIPMVLPTREEDAMFRALAYINAARGLRLAPVHHLTLVREIQVDPGQLENQAAHVGENGIVTLFQSRTGGGTDIVRVLIHEVGHVVWYRGVGSTTAFAPRWSQAARADNAAVSIYGTTDDLEDFAEAYLMYIVNRTSCERQFPHRAAILSSLVNPPPAVPTPTPSTTPTTTPR